MYLRNKEIEAQNRAELAELAISLEEKCDFCVALSEILNATNTKIDLPPLSNEDFSYLVEPEN